MPLPSAPGGPAENVPDAYRPHAAFISPARARPELWRTVTGLIVALVAGVALYQLALSVFASLAGPETLRRVMDEATFYGDTPRATLIALFSYAFFGAGLAMALQALHGRGLMSLIGPWEAALSDFLRVFYAVGFLFAVLLVVLPQDMQAMRNPDLPTRLWVWLLPLSVLAILVQAGTEELVFRGYLQQQLGVAVRSWPAWLVLPAVLFGFAHWSPEAAGPNASAYVIWATLFALLAADLTARTGTLGAALGFHFTNNAFAMLGTSLAGPGSGLALYLLPMAADAPEVARLVPVELATLVVAWLAARLALKV